MQLWTTHMCISVLFAYGTVLKHNNFDIESVSWNLLNSFIDYNRLFMIVDFIGSAT
jgi:hypothetical protein